MDRPKAIQQVANLGITRNLGHAEQTLGIIAPFPALHVALVGQKGRRLGEKDPKGPQHRIAQRILAILARAWVGQLLAGGNQNRQQLPPR
jgi:hypothetical protein